MSNPTYAFMSNSLVLSGPGGSINLGGHGAGSSDEGFTISRSGDKNTMTIGAGGSGMHSLHSDNSGTISVHLLKTSPVNALLTDLYNFQASSPAYWGQNTLVHRDTSRGDGNDASQCAFKKMSDLVYAKDGNTNVWVFDCITIDTVLG